MKRFGLLLTFVLVLGLAMPVLGAEFSFNGDLNHRFTAYTDQSGMFSGAGETSGDQARASNRIKDGGISDHWGGIKYRMWTTASTNDGAVKGVYAIEIGNMRFGSAGGGGYSGDGRNVETRWAYTDLQLPFVESKSRVTIGLAPVKVNYYLWNETAMGVQWYGAMDEMFDYKIAWIRGFERFRTTTTQGNDADSFFGRADLKPIEGMKLGAFANYTFSRGATASGTISDFRYEKKFIASADVDLDVYELGVDGSFKADMGLFVNWDLIYQGGEINDAMFTATNLGTTPVAQDYDVSAYFLHADVGFGWDDFKVTLTGWYASGDDDETDDDFEGFFSTDVDIFTGSTVLMESYDDDNYFTERPYILDKGLILLKGAFDWNATAKLKVGTALAYMLTAEDVEYIDGDGTAGNNRQSEDEVGVELMGYMSYKLYQNVEFAINAGYLWAGDAMDYWEEDSIRDGSSDEDIFRSMARVRYKF